MKKVLAFLFFFTAISQAQDTIRTELINKIPFETEILVDITQDSTIYHIKNSGFIKLKDNKELSYSNLELGEITSADTFNPLKINLFYHNFNTAIILDNRLSEMHEIDFNSLEDYKNVSHISACGDNTIWVFNENTQQLELFDFRQNKTLRKTLPVASEVEAIESNYNYCWLLTENYLYCYSYFGSLVYKIENDDFETMALVKDQCIIKKEDNLFLIQKETHKLILIQLDDVNIERFFVTNETLYIYDDDYIYNFKIK